MTKKQPTVLAVDSRQEIVDLYAAWLGDDYEVSTAYSGRGALKTVDESTEVVLLERKMPGVNGDRMVAEIRERDLGCRIAFVTVLDPGFDVVGVDIDEYLLKPVVRDELEETVERLCERNADDEQLCEYHALLSTKATLEETKTRSELAHSDAYRQLVDRIEDLAEQADTAKPCPDPAVSFRESGDR